jgi:transcription termination factor Rho
MTVLTREALEASPLADLHTIAKELSLDGFRRLRKAELVDAILERQGGAEGGVADEDAGTDATDEQPKRRRARGGRGRRKAEEDGATDEDAGSDAVAEPEADAEEEAPKPKRTRARRARKTVDADADADEAPAAEDEDRAPAAGAEDRVVEGTVELLGNGSGFVRLTPGDPSDDDVYVSAAQVRRCELVDGDVVTGPVRAPRRSERYPSLVRVDTINGRPADEVAEGTPWDELSAVHPTERFVFGSEDPTLKAVEWLTPIGRGSRVTIAGPQLSGKTEALRRLAAALAAQEGLEVSLVLAGVRPEETSHWAVEPAASLALGASAEARSQAVERTVDTARRLAARGGHAVVLIDTLDGLEPRVAARALAAARAIEGGGSLTVIATATAPIGGETTVVALDARLTAAGRFPALDLLRSATLRPDLLVGEAGAEAILQARAQALGA